MSTITRPRPAVKSTTKRPPREPFGAGLIDPALEPRIDLAELTEEERVMLYGPPAECVPLPIEPDEPGPSSRLPKTDGSGLTQAEWRRMNGAHNRARYAYAIDCPDADAIELDRVAQKAAGDELRRLLRDRPAAAPPAPPIATSDMVAGDDDGPESWPAWTDDDVWELGPEDQGGNDEPESERPPVERGAHFEPSTADRVWWCENAPSSVREVSSKPGRRPMRPITDRDVRRVAAVG